ncbi:MAG: VWA domain-containing protein, partial [Vicinamibacteria bacterium]|nr:VWA domain-containing protein [Vicinamibacteria bacterium]
MKKAVPGAVLVLFLVTFVVVGGQQDQPRVRAEANLVRVDVYPTAADGQAVTDLTADDFEVREDGVPQAVTGVEHVALERSRVVVVFLDTYHSDTAAVRAIHPSLVRLLDAVLTPDDVIAVMTPEMSARDVTFARKGGGVAPALESVRQWASQDPSRLRDPDEQRYALCFPDQGGSACPDVVGPSQQGPVRAFAPYRGVALEMAVRRHGQRSVQALVDLSRTLRAVNDGRKAVLMLSGGWPLYRENLAMARMVRCGLAEQRGEVDDDARPPARREGMADVADQTICDADRRRLAEIDLQSAFQRMLDGVNTATASVYPIDTGGPSRIDAASSLRLLAEQTDGAAIANLDVPSGGSARLVQDMSSYYLVTYQSTNARADGGFRRVDVMVKRRGVTLRSRRGYRAATAGELERQRTEAVRAGQTVSGAITAVQAAIEGLGQLRASMPVRTRVAYAPAGAGHVRLWAVAEIDSTTSREGAWLGGGAVDAELSGSDNRALASAEGALAGGQRTVLLDLGQVDVPGTTTSLRVRLQPAGEGPPLKDVVGLAPIGAAGDPGVPVLLRRGATTGTRYVPTADPQFRRTERLRVELPRTTPHGTFTASMLDRAGAPLPLPVTTTTRTDGTITWATAEVSLAPLAH